MPYSRYMGFNRASVLPVLIWTLAALIMVDIVVTYAGISWFGAIEGNPLFYLIGQQLEYFMAAKIMISLGLLYGIWHMRHNHPIEHPLCVLTVLYFMVMVNNLIVVGWI
jgi:hypothetical protein